MYEILIVDDHTHLVDSLAIALPWEQMGIANVYKAYSGEEALELLNYRSVDIVVTDIQMNGMTGLELIARINEKWKNTKAVIITGYDEFQYAKEALQQQVCDYLLKPVSNEELEQTLRHLIERITEEGKELLDQQKFAYRFRESLPKLREMFLFDLLSGKKYPRSDLQDKLQLYGLPFDAEREAILVCMRVEEDYANTDLYSLSLIEYAMFNIVEEVFSKRFHVMYCKDSHDYLIFLVQAKPMEAADTDSAATIEDLARLSQHQIKLYLKSKASLVLSSWGEFPADVLSMYHAALSVYTDYIGYQTESFFHVTQQKEAPDIRPLAELYRSQTFMELIDIEQWTAFENKLTRIFDELERTGGGAREYGVEIYVTLLQAYSYYLHKKGKRIFEVFGRDIEKMLRMDASWSVDPLKEWAFASFVQIKAYSDSRSDNIRSGLMERIRRFIQKNVKDITLQAVADHVHLHPVYVSNLFKQETGENFSNYVLRLRMERAVELLKDTDWKIVQVAHEVGYQKPQYFIKLFKSHYGLTPQEFKNGL
ncbi:response regulator transcription factor [Paenibacillus methanolicus]|uniref:Two-component system response regulator YesN n=1 Tax=Paenibacillus methanolicus TaxID=582686 RepID=A0A5S5BPP8_9BACL|nr:response regulator [Paenibacillus methanolicus]TYP69161.1 two-component system response regulator YesN [Paenibacillus methanolicus]